MFSNHRILKFNSEKNVSKVLQWKIHAFSSPVFTSIFLFWQIEYKGILVLAFIALCGPSNKRYSRLYYLYLHLPSLLIIIVLVVKTINHLQIEVRKDHLPFY